MIALDELAEAADDEAERVDGPAPTPIRTAVATSWSTYVAGRDLLDRLAMPERALRRRRSARAARSVAVTSRGAPSACCDRRAATVSPALLAQLVEEASVRRRRRSARRRCATIASPDCEAGGRGRRPGWTSPIRDADGRVAERGRCR